MLSVQRQMLGTVPRSSREIQHTLFFPSLFYARFLSCHHHTPHLGSWMCHPLGTSFTSVAWRHVIHSNYTLMMSIQGQNCLLKGNHSIYWPQILSCVFLPLMSMRRTQLLQKLTAASLCPHIKPHSGVPFLLHLFRCLLILVVLWSISFQLGLNSSLACSLEVVSSLAMKQPFLQIHTIINWEAVNIRLVQLSSLLLQV